MIRWVLTICLSLAAMPALAAIDIEEVTSPGGIDAWLVEEDSLPFVSLEIRFRGGTALDAPETRGAINLMTGLLEEGSGDLDAQGFARARDDLAASFSFRAGQDAISVSARFLSENREDAVALLRDALVDPRFEQSAIDRVRDQVLSGIAQDATDPGAIARRTWASLAFPDHPYGTPGEGTFETVNALDRDDIAAAHAAALARDRIVVGAVGDIAPDELGALLDTLFEGLPAEGAPMPGEAEYALEPGVEVVDLDTPQSVILFGHEGIARDDPDFFAAYVANEIFGGSGFNARLMEEVRVKRGLTYGIGTYLAPMDRAALVMGQTASGNGVAAETVEVIEAEWARIARGVTEDELDAAKTYLTGAYPLRFDGNGTIADILAGMQLDGLPTDYVNTRNDEIEAVTLDDVARVADRVYRAGDLSFVVVGQPEGLPPAD